MQQSGFYVCTCTKWLGHCNFVWVYLVSIARKNIVLQFPIDKGNLFANRLLVWNYWYEPVIGVNECIVAANLMYYRETFQWLRPNDGDGALLRNLEK